MTIVSINRQQAYHSMLSSKCNSVAETDCCSANETTDGASIGNGGGKTRPFILVLYV
jgi:hypothetical protein